MSYQSRQRSSARSPLGPGLDKASGPRRRSELDWRLGGATGGHEPGPVALHLGVGVHPVPEAAQGFGRDRIRRLRDAIMDPLAFTASRDDAGSSKVSQMARNLRLALTERFDEEADANLVAANHVEKPQSRSVAKRLKEAFDVLCCCCHSS